MPEGQFSEDIIRKVSKTVLNAAEHRKHKLFDKLTVANAEKIAEISGEKPIFYKNKENAPKEIMLDEEIAGLMPDGFFKNPTQWIESQPRIVRGDEKNLSQGELISELWDEPYDVSKVREISLSSPSGEKIKIVSKRIDQRQSREIVLTKKAYDVGMPTPKILGEVLDRGNTYGFYEYLPGLNLQTIIEFFEEKYGYNSQFPSQCLYYETDKEEVLKKIGEDLSFLSREAQEKLLETFEENKINAVRRMIITVLYPGNWHSKTELERDLKQRINFLKNKFSESEISDALKYVGYESFEDYLNAMIMLNQERNPEKSDKLGDHFKELTNGLIKRGREQMDSIVRKDLFGFDYLEEARELEKRSLAKGIFHKDFEYRNLIVLWDFENGKPLPRKADEPKLYIIDWEGAEIKS